MADYKLIPAAVFGGLLAVGFIGAGALIGQGVMGHLLDHLVGHGRDVRARQRAVRNVDRVAHGGRDDLGVDVRVVREIELSVDLLEFIAAVGSGDGDRGVGDLDPAPEHGGRRGRSGGGPSQGFGHIPTFLPIPVQLQRQAF